MADDQDTQPITELVDVWLRRAAKSLQDQNPAAALEDMRAVLQHLRRVGADPAVLQALSDLIASSTREGGDPAARD